MQCQRCHKEIADGSLFCNWCGRRQQATTAPAQRKKRRRPRGSGTVYKKADEYRNKPFVAVTGSKEVLGHFATAGEAVQALDTYNTQRTPAARLKYTFADVYARWSEQHYKDVGASSKDSYERAFSKAEKLHKREMRELKTEDYQTVIDDLTAAGLSRSMCEKQRQLFSHLCKWAMQQDIINKNYAEGLRLPPTAQKKERTLTSEEEQAIRSVASDKSNRLAPTAEFALVLLYTGMRITELLSMRRDDVHLSEGYMVGGMKTETGKNRIIPVLEPVRLIVASWMLDSIGSEYLLPTANGRRKDTNSVEHSFRSLMKQCGIEGVTPHTLRHTAATRMIEAGVAPTAVQAILGHKDFSTTANIYTSHNNPEYLIKEMGKISGSL